MTTRQASWRGIPFAVKSKESGFGRRAAVHEYAKKDIPWIEDMGRKTRRFDLTGFLISDSLIYGGGAVQDQVDRMVAAAETAGEGILIHPDFGRLTVNCASLSVSSDFEATNVATLRFSFYESGQRQFPSALADTRALVEASATAADTVSATTFALKDVPTITRGDGSIGRALAYVEDRIERLAALASDATSLLKQSSLLSGNFGRYVNGRSIGFLSSTALGGLYSDVQSLISAGAALRASVAIAAGQVRDGLNALGVSVTGAQISSLITAHVAAVSAACFDPADKIRVLCALIDQPVSHGLVNTDAGIALDNAYRLSALIALGRAAPAYNAANYDDAVAVRQAITTRLDPAIIAHADAGRLDVSQALRALKGVCVRDFQSRGADLAPLRTVNTPRPIPALKLAQTLYADPDRASELVLQADPIHPLFMPTTFKALSV